MNQRLLVFALAFSVSIVFACPAWADVPPPDGYVERCTIADQQTATSECLDCYATRGMADRCEPLLVPYCFTKVCHTWSGSSEVWCRTAGPGLPAVPSTTLDALRPTGYPLPPAIDGGIAAPPSVCLPYVPADAGASSPSSSDPDKSKESSGCAVGGWISTRALGPWIVAGLFAGLVALRRRRGR
jgi:hypothetical protein